MRKGDQIAIIYYDLLYAYVLRIRPTDVGKFDMSAVGFLICQFSKQVYLHM